MITSRLIKVLLNSLRCIILKTSCLCLLILIFSSSAESSKHVPLCGEVGHVASRVWSRRPLEHLDSIWCSRAAVAPQPDEPPAGRPVAKPRCAVLPHSGGKKVQRRAAGVRSLLKRSHFLCSSLPVQQQTSHVNSVSVSESKTWIQQSPRSGKPQRKKSTITSFSPSEVKNKNYCNHITFFL